jgi:hypothetical protein
MWVTFLAPNMHSSTAECDEKTEYVAGVEMRSVDFNGVSGHGSKRER